MNTQGQKTGGRQKGTPNKVTASMKIMIKAFFINNYDELQEAFDKAKPSEKLNFWAKMTPYICAKTVPDYTNGGEWTPGSKMDTQWFDPIDEEVQQDRLCKRELMHINLSRARRAARMEDLRYIEAHNRLREIQNMDEQERKELFEEECREFESKYNIDINKPCLKEEQEAFPWQTYNPKDWINQAIEKNFIPKPQDQLSSESQNQENNHEDSPVECGEACPQIMTSSSEDSTNEEREKYLQHSTADSQQDNMTIYRIPEDNQVGCGEGLPHHENNSLNLSTLDTSPTSIPPVNRMPLVPQMPDSDEETERLVKFYKGHLNQIKENMIKRIQQNINLIESRNHKNE